MSAKSVETVVESGTEVFIPLNKLKKSPKNARKTPHSEASIEAYAASIAAIAHRWPAEVDGTVTMTPIKPVDITTRSRQDRSRSSRRARPLMTRRGPIGIRKSSPRSETCASCFHGAVAQYP
jgi:hypothetical protein